MPHRRSHSPPASLSQTVASWPLERRRPPGRRLSSDVARIRFVRRRPLQHRHGLHEQRAARERDREGRLPEERSARPGRARHSALQFDAAVLRRLRPRLQRRRRRAAGGPADARRPLREPRLGLPRAARCRRRARGAALLRLRALLARARSAEPQPALPEPEQAQHALRGHVARNGRHLRPHHGAARGAQARRGHSCPRRRRQRTVECVLRRRRVAGPVHGRVAAEAGQRLEG